MNEKRQKRKFSFPVTSLAGSSLPNFVRLIYRHRVHPRYFVRFSLSLLASAILEPFRHYENLIWRKRLNAISIESPVFIIGFWRTGTTLLHNLLCQDPNAGYVTTFHTVFPHEVLTQGWWLKRLTNYFLPARRPFDHMSMDMDFPQEEEIALANMQGLSFYKFWYFPSEFDRYYQSDLFLKQVLSGRLRRWIKEYRVLIRKALVNTAGKRFISKNPSNLGRIRPLLELFPNARFIFTYRDPYMALESFYRFSHEVLPATCLQPVSEGRSKEIYARVFADLLQRYEEDKALIPAGNLIELKFEEFEKDKIATLQRIYSQFCLEGWEEALPRFESYIAGLEGYQKTRYDLSPETIQLVNRFMGGQLQSWGYDRKDPDNT